MVDEMVTGKMATEIGKMEFGRGDSEQGRWVLGFFFGMEKRKN